LLENDIYVFRIEDEIYKDIKKRKDDSILIETIFYSLEIKIRFSNETQKPILLQYYIGTEGGVKRIQNKHQGNNIGVRMYKDV